MNIRSRGQTSLKNSHEIWFMAYYMPGKCHDKLICVFTVFACFCPCVQAISGTPGVGATKIVVKQRLVNQYLNQGIWLADMTQLRLN